MFGLRNFWGLSTAPVKWSRILVFILVVGVFVQITGKVWIQSGSARNTQVYIWLLLPALIFIFYKVVVKFEFALPLEYFPWLLFLLWVALSTAWAYGGDEDAFSLAKRGVFIAFYLVALRLLMTCDEEALRRVLQASVVVIAIGALVSIFYQFLILGQPFEYRAYRIDRSGIGDFANYGWPVAAGIFHGAIGVWAIGFALDKKLSFRTFAFWLFVFSILVFYVLLTYTRGAWFALLAGGMVSIVFNNSRRGWLLFLAGFLALLALLVWFWPQLVFEIEHRKLSGRGPIWDYFFEVMPGYWLWGHGLGTPFNYVWPYANVTSPHAHSLYLQQVYDSGLLSLLLLCIGVLGIFYKAWKLRKIFWVQLAFPVLIYSLIAMLTDVERIFTRPGDYWTVFWLPVAILLAIPSPIRERGKS